MNDLIREAIAAEADKAVDSRTVLAELHRRKKRRRPIGMILGVATLTAAAAAAAIIVPTTIKTAEVSPAAPPPATPQNVLLIGADDYGHTDALVYAHFEADGSVSAVSLPRDIFAGPIGSDKINTLFQADPAKLTAAVEKLTGTKVDHYAAIKMADFGRIAQVVGGVEVCLAAAAKDSRSGVDLPAGKQTLSGDQALAFLRQRMGLTNGDLDRTRRHQAFLTGLAAKITKDNAPALAREVSRSIKVDDGWDVLEFAQRFQGPIKISTATLPVGEPVQTETAAGFEVDPAQAKKFVEEQFAGKAPTTDACVR